ncbi:MAG: DUF2065 domain-containing protein [Deltaproteobacteria bacterium]|jgi:uncharacterized protein YjeT (DUF2065 family)|nr:DUF2065 domain-containing protein [Deltaproteobacteria bacterium]
MEFFLSVIGMVLVIEGIPYFAVPEKMKEVMKMAQMQPDNVLRVFGGILMLVGLIIVFLAKGGISLQ